MNGWKDKLKGTPSKDEGDLKGDLLIRDLWAQGTDSINEMRVVNTDATSYQSKTPEKCLKNAEKEKKKKYLNACLKNCRNFTNFVASVDGLLRVEAEATLKLITSRLVTKWKETYSRTCRYVKSRVEINLV